MTLKGTLLAALFAVQSLAMTAPAFAQGDYPSKPIRIIVPFAAGGVVDSIARLVGERLSAKYGQPVIVENRTGAGGSIGTDYVAKAAPDGYTLLCVSPGHAVTPSLIKGVAWNPVRDFRAIEGFGVIPNVFVVPTEVPAKTMAELVAMAKKANPPLTYATAGVGTSNHLSGELLAQSAEIKLTHVPYRGQPDALGDLLAGRVTMMPLTVALAVPHIKTGKLRPLAVTTAERVAQFPEVPTLKELGLLDDPVLSWYALIAPARTPAAIVAKLYKAYGDAAQTPEIQKLLAAQGLIYLPMSSAEFQAGIDKETARWARIIQDHRIEVTP